jgi:hypothetical protein
MVRRLNEARLMKKLGHRALSPLIDLPDYSNRLGCRTKEYRLARLLSGWPALVEEDHLPAGLGLVEEPVVPLTLRRAA